MSAPVVSVALGAFLTGICESCVPFVTLADRDAVRVACHLVSCRVVWCVAWLCWVTCACAAATATAMSRTIKAARMVVSSDQHDEL